MKSNARRMAVDYLALALTLCTALVLAPASPLSLPVSAASSGAPSAFTALPNGLFYTEANGHGGAGETGFAVLDEAWSGSSAPPLGVRFFSEFQRLGGVAGVGYPASRPFELDGFVVQAMQKGIFQWRPEVERVFFLNVFDELHDGDLDDQLYARRQVPRMADWAADAGLPWDTVRARHLALLDGYPRLRAQYDAAANPLDLYGLPMSPVVDFGPFYAVRLQRAVFQQYKVTTSYAQPGDVLVVNGGDVAKEYGLVPAWAGAPHGRPRWSDRIVALVPNAGDVVGSTFRVVGDAQVFEAQFRWQIRAAGGSVLREGPASASMCCDWARFLIDVDLTGLSLQPAQQITLVLYEPSARDGSATGVVEVPLTYHA